MLVTLWHQRVTMAKVKCVCPKIEKEGKKKSILRDAQKKDS